MSHGRPIQPSLLMATLAAFASAACDAPLGSAPSDPPPASATRGQLAQELPFRLSADAIVLGQEFAPGFGPPTFGRSDFDGRCSVPSDFVVGFALEGQATHLGSFTGVAEHCSQVDFAQGGSTISDGVMVLTAADGDELWTSYVRVTLGEGQPEDHEFTGGTGRFAGASGRGLGHPDCDRSTGTCTFELEGVIVYDASDRSE